MKCQARGPLGTGFDALRWEQGLPPGPLPPGCGAAQEGQRRYQTAGSRGDQRGRKATGRAASLIPYLTVSAGILFRELPALEGKRWRC